MILTLADSVNLIKEQSKKDQDKFKKQVKKLADKFFKEKHCDPLKVDNDKSYQYHLNDFYSIMVGNLKNGADIEEEIKKDKALESLCLQGFYEECLYQAEKYLENIQVNP